MISGKFEIFLIVFALIVTGLFFFTIHVARVLFRQWRQEVVLHAETKRQLEQVQENEELRRKTAGEEDVLSAEIIK